jgi:hypothetical protein
MGPDWPSEDSSPVKMSGHPDMPEVGGGGRDDSSGRWDMRQTKGRAADHCFALVHMKTEAWAQDAAANHGLGSHLLSSVGELGAGAGAGGAAVSSPGLYKGGPMTDEHDRLAIRAIIQHHMPKSRTVTKCPISRAHKCQ